MQPIQQFKENRILGFLFASLILKMRESILTTLARQKFQPKEKTLSNINKNRPILKKHLLCLGYFILAIWIFFKAIYFHTLMIASI